MFDYGTNKGRNTVTLAVFSFLINGEDLKISGTEFWESDNGKDTYGFSAIGGGYYKGDKLMDFKKQGALWSSTSLTQGTSLIPGTASYFHIPNFGPANAWSSSKDNLLNVRCIRDTSSGGVDQ